MEWLLEMIDGFVMMIFFLLLLACSLPLPPGLTNTTNYKNMMSHVDTD